MVIELSGVQFGLKSYAWFQNWTSAQREFDLKSQVWFQTKIAGHEMGDWAKIKAEIKSLDPKLTHKNSRAEFPSPKILTMD